MPEAISWVSKYNVKYQPTNQPKDTVPVLIELIVYWGRQMLNKHREKCNTTNGSKLYKGKDQYAFQKNRLMMGRLI